MTLSQTVADELAVLSGLHVEPHTVCGEYVFHLGDGVTFTTTPRDESAVSFATGVSIGRRIQQMARSEDCA